MRKKQWTKLLGGRFANQLPQCRRRSGLSEAILSRLISTRFPLPIRKQNLRTSSPTSVWFPVVPSGATWSHCIPHLRADHWAQTATCNNTVLLKLGEPPFQQFQQHSGLPRQGPHVTFSELAVRKKNNSNQQLLGLGANGEYKGGNAVQPQRRAFARPLLCRRFKIFHQGSVPAYLPLHIKWHFVLCMPLGNRIVVVLRGAVAVACNLRTGKIITRAPGFHPHQDDYCK